MAYKYNYNKAISHVYPDLICINNDGVFSPNCIGKLDTFQKEICLKHLEYGCKMNDFASISHLIFNYRNGFGVEKNNKKADSLKLIILKIHSNYKEVSPPKF